MGYRKRTRKFPRAIEVTELHDDRHRWPGRQRAERKKPTPESMQRANLRRREDKARWKLREYFKEDDNWFRLSYDPEQRPPDMKTAREQYGKFIRKLKREYMKRGYELYWMKNIEVGSRNAWHVHLIFNELPDANILKIVKQLWPYGDVAGHLCYEKGEFEALAKYVTKTPKTPGYEKRLRETHFSTSQNMPLKDPEETTIRRFDTFMEKDVRNYHKGWYVDKSSVVEGINPYTGWPFRKYTLYPLDKKKAQARTEEHLRGLREITDYKGNPRKRRRKKC